MSGGTFDYFQTRHQWYEAIEKIEREIERNEHEYPQEVIDEFKNGLIHIKKAKIYLQRIDYLLADDDGPENFLIRLKSELKNVKS